MVQITTARQNTHMSINLQNLQKSHTFSNPAHPVYAETSKTVGIRQKKIVDLSAANA